MVMMLSERLLILDLTEDTPRAMAAGGGQETFDIPAETLRVALRAEPDGLPPGLPPGLVDRAGAEAVEWLEDDRTLVVEKAVECAPMIEDAELQTRLLRAVWDAIRREVEQRSQARRTLGYIIPPANYPVELLERWRRCCAEDRSFKIAGFVTEAAALTVGFLQSEFFKQAASDGDLSAPGAIGLIVADGDAIEVVCFDYDLDPSGRRRARIRDRFRTDCDSFAARLNASDWLNRLSSLVSLKSPDFDHRSQEVFAAVQEAVGRDVKRRTFRTPSPSLLKLQGAAHVARCCAGRGDLPDEYVIETAFNVGLRISQHQAHPILRKEDAARIAAFPHEAVKTFKLRGVPGAEWRLSLYCGYSELVAESTLLGSCLLKRPELKKLADSGATTLAASVRLDAPGAGELILRLLPDDQVVGRAPFTLPGLVI